VFDALPLSYGGDIVFLLVFLRNLPGIEHPTADPSEISLY
jgi:hypothetical protein